MSEKSTSEIKLPKKGPSDYVRNTIKDLDKATKAYKRKPEKRNKNGTFSKRRIESDSVLAHKLKMALAAEPEATTDRVREIRHLITGSAGAKRRYAERRKIGVCVYCGKPLAEGSLIRCDACKAAFNAATAADPNHKIKASRWSKTRIQKIKIEVFNAYGGPICKCCGDTHMDFLSLDHVNNDGGAHRKKLPASHRCGAGFYSWLKQNGFPKDPELQVLCMNCNFAKGKFGKCPHELERGAKCSGTNNEKDTK